MDGADVIDGYGQHNVIYAFNKPSSGDPEPIGNSIINAGSGDDTVHLYEGDDVVNLSGYNNSVVDFFDTSSGNFTITGSSGGTTIELQNSDDIVSLGGWGNTVDLYFGDNQVAPGSGDDIVNLSAGTDKVTLAGRGNKVTLDQAIATLSGGEGNETVNAGDGTYTLTLAGQSDLVNFSGDVNANVTDAGSYLKIEIGSAIETLTIHGFDTHGVIDLLNGVGGYANGAAAVAGLKSDGHGGALLSLGSGGSIDFVNLAPNKLSAANFAVG